MSEFDQFIKRLRSFKLASEAQIKELKRLHAAGEIPDRSIPLLINEIVRPITTAIIKAGIAELKRL